MTVAVRFAAVSELPVLMKELIRAGIAPGLIDGGAIEDGPDLLATLGRALAFPSYYGRNWDAAEECLRDLAERHPEGAALVIERAGTLWQRLPREMGLLTALWLAASETAAIPLRLVFLLEPGP